MSTVFRRERATEFCELVENLLISSLQLSKTFEKSLKRGAGSRCGLNGGKISPHNCASLPLPDLHTCTTAPEKDSGKEKGWTEKRTIHVWWQK